MTEEKDDVEELKEVLDVVSERVPALLRGLRDVLYSKDAAANMAEAVATFYKGLVEAGIPKEDALDMARGYMINLRDILGRKGLGGINLGKDFDVDEKEEG
ncbi:hypothetical protein H5T52_02180 [Candidatus Bipolaricaulota bacterium]|nr:hypothetical protein [Candidatus Bipolaricaulota bacterium]